MHEFGHNLGLLHGGPDCFNNKPNYVSVMSYSFFKTAIPVGASPGDTVAKSCSTDDDCAVGDHAVTAHCSTTTNTCFRIDYSDRVYNTLDETGFAGGLDETIGLQGGANNTDISFRAHDGFTPAFVKVPTNGVPVDWNWDGSIEAGAIQDVNGDAQKAQLDPQNDWATTSINGVNNFTNLKLSYQCNTNFSDDLIIPRDLRLGKEGPMVATARPSFERLFQKYWLAAARAQPAGFSLSKTMPQIVGQPTAAPRGNKQDFLWRADHRLD